MCRFRWKRRRAALALLPAAVVPMLILGLAGVTPTSPATAAGVSFSVKHHVRVGESVVLHGRVDPAGVRPVLIKVGARKVKTVRSGEDGRFQVRWRASRAGVFEAKAIVDGSRVAQASRSPGSRVNVYRPAAASYYGPGLYGNGTSCGKILSPSIQGVAHRTLPCGAPVTLRYRDRTVTVPVIDRGPFSGNREYDLTTATKSRLRFGSTGTVLTTR